MSYIYMLLLCTMAYNKMESTRLRFFFRCFTHVSRNDPVIIRMTATLEEDDEANGGALGEGRHDIFEPLNQDGELDSSFVPLTPRELNILKIEKADKTLAEEVCSICCDNFEEKAKIRKMPICEHKFHK